MIHSFFSQVIHFFRRPPAALAFLQGSRTHPALHGRVGFYPTPEGVLVAAEVQGLPAPKDPCQSPVFGLHIHEGGICGSGGGENAFAAAGGHWNPAGCPHPYHAGDLLPLWGAHGIAFMVFLTDRFGIEDIIGKTVILHSSPDDFTTQPSGHAGARIACGVIHSYGFR